jgi:hypothetical protein
VTAYLRSLPGKGKTDGEDDRKRGECEKGEKECDDD